MGMRVMSRWILGGTCLMSWAGAVPELAAVQPPAMASPAGDDDPEMLRLLIESQERNEFLTGLVYVAPDRRDFVSMQEMTDTPLALLPDEKLRPTRETIEKIMETI